MWVSEIFGCGLHGAGIKPIVGADVYLETELLGDEYAHLTILARDNVGYQNLTLLISEAYKHGYGAAWTGYQTRVVNNI